MKEKRTYKKLDGMSLLAAAGCIAVLAFESLFIFELYNRADWLVPHMLQAPDAPSAEPDVPSAPVG